MKKITVRRLVCSCLEAVGHRDLQIVATLHLRYVAPRAVVVDTSIGSIGRDPVEQLHDCRN